MLNLRQLRYFVDVAEVQSVTIAASRLRVAQPALSRHIRSLERELGVQLFSRSGRGIKLTPAGSKFRDKIVVILEEIDKACVEIQAIAHTAEGRVNLGMPASLSGILTWRLIRDVEDMLPQVVFRVIDGWTDFIVEWLLLGRLDLGIIYDYPSRGDQLHVEDLATEQLFLISGIDGTKFDPMKPLSLEEISALPLVLPSIEHGWRVSIDKQMNDVGLTTRIEMEIESGIVIKQVVEKSKYYTILPVSEVTAELQSGRLFSTPTNPVLARTLSLAWPRERTVEPEIRALIEIIRREVSVLEKEGAFGEARRNVRNGTLSNG